MVIEDDDGVRMSLAMGTRMAAKNKYKKREICFDFFHSGRNDCMSGMETNRRLRWLIRLWKRSEVIVVGDLNDRTRCRNRDLHLSSRNV